jgi:hypothetical protein
VLRRKRSRFPCAFAVHGPSFPAAALVDSFSEFLIRRIASANFVRANHAICTHVCTVNKIRIRMRDFSAQRCASTRDACARCAIAATTWRRRCAYADVQCDAAVAMRRAGDGAWREGADAGAISATASGGAHRPRRKRKRPPG